jgi:hypothetical protein
MEMERPPASWRVSNPRRIGSGGISLTMGQRVKWIGSTELSAHGKADNAEVLDLAAKSLIDGLIVPYLVEEFLRLYGPATGSKSSHKSQHSQPESELNSTP